jgi:hypothetical protein
MKQLIVFLICVLAIISCQKNKCTLAKYSYNFSENRKVDTVRFGGYILSVQIIPGNNIVFSYSLLGESCPNRTDGPSSERLVFEIPAGVTNFEYSDATIQSAQCYYENSSGAGSTNDATRMIRGIIKRDKISANSWLIEVNLAIPLRVVPLSFRQQFNLG